MLCFIYESTANDPLLAVKVASGVLIHEHPLTQFTLETYFVNLFVHHAVAADTVLYCHNSLSAILKSKEL